MCIVQNCPSDEKKNVEIIWHIAGTIWKMTKKNVQKRYEEHLLKIGISGKIKSVSIELPMEFFSQSNSILISVKAIKKNCMHF